MQTILHVSKSATWKILNWMREIVLSSQYAAKQLIKDIDESLTEELAELISAEVLKTNPVFTATTNKAELFTDFRWNFYFKEHFLK